MASPSERFTIADALAEVCAVYATLAGRPVERDCVRRTECCQFNLTGRTPYLTKGEALVAAKALRSSGRKKLPTPDHDGCPLLDGKTGRCLIYDGRPFGCRTHFCRAAGGPYTRDEVRDLIRQLEAIDTHLGGRGGVALPIAIEMALRGI